MPTAAEPTWSPEDTLKKTFGNRKQNHESTDINRRHTYRLEVTALRQAQLCNTHSWRYGLTSFNGCVVYRDVKRIRLFARGHLKPGTESAEAFREGHHYGN